MRVRVVITAGIAVVSLAGARLAREQAHAMVSGSDVDVPYAPSRAGARFVSCGYRELFADLLVVRFRSYFSAGQPSPQTLGDLAEAVTTLDPTFQKMYEWGAIALTQQRNNANALRAVALLEAGARQFPASWRIPNLAGQIYLVDLEAKPGDTKQRQAWDQRGALLLDSAARKPGAPASGALTAAHFQSKLGQRDRAIENLRELLLVTDDDAARTKILEKLAALSSENQDEIAAELLVARKQFDAKWKAERSTVPVSMYVLVGKPLAKSFDMVDLALGGVSTSEAAFERLEPLY